MLSNLKNQYKLTMDKLIAYLIPFFYLINFLFCSIICF